MFSKTQIVAFVFIGLVVIGMDWMFWEITSDVSTDTENYMLIQVVRGTAVLTPIIMLIGSVAVQVIQRTKKRKKDKI